MNFALDEEHIIIRDSVRAFASEVVRAAAHDADEAAEFARALGAIRPKIDAAAAAVEARDRAEGAEPREARTALSVGGAAVAFEVWIGARPEPASIFTLSVTAPPEDALGDAEGEG